MQSSATSEKREVKVNQILLADTDSNVVGIISWKEACLGLLTQTETGRYLYKSRKEITKLV